MAFASIIVDFGISLIVYLFSISILNFWKSFSPVLREINSLSHKFTASSLIFSKLDLALIPILFLYLLSFNNLIISFAKSFSFVIFTLIMPSWDNKLLAISVDTIQGSP